jgi:hypothetical protein
MLKKIFFLIVIVLMVGCKSKQAVLKRNELAPIALTEIPEVQKNRVASLGKQVLNTCNTSKFIPFKDSEATPKVIKNMTIDRLTKTCLKFRLKYGDFKDLKLMEVYQINSKKITIYRFKALYEKKIANKELRVTLNENNQIAAVKSDDWTDSFHLELPKN